MEMNQLNMAFCNSVLVHSASVATHAIKKLTKTKPQHQLEFLEVSSKDLTSSAAVSAKLFHQHRKNSELSNGSRAASSRRSKSILYDFRYHEFNLVMRVVLVIRALVM